MLVALTGIALRFLVRYECSKESYDKPLRNHTQSILSLVYTI